VGGALVLNDPPALAATWQSRPSPPLMQHGHRIMPSIRGSHTSPFRLIMSILCGMRG